MRRGRSLEIFDEVRLHPEVGPVHVLMLHAGGMVHWEQAQGFPREEGLDPLDAWRNWPLSATPQEKP